MAHSILGRIVRITTMVQIDGLFWYAGTEVRISTISSSVWLDFGEGLRFPRRMKGWKTGLWWGLRSFLNNYFSAAVVLL